MGEVYLARLVGELGFEKRLVIKTILPELAADPMFIELFAAEAKTAVALSHGNIVPTYELGRADETFYIVMGYVDGPSVAQVLTVLSARDEPPPLPLALHLIKGVLSGLAYAHRDSPGRAAVVHRDITPRNILIDRSGQVRIVDFGIAAPAKQKSGIRAGSIGYIAPEQARGATPDPRADVFSVGCLLYELCTLQRAFPKEDVWLAPDLSGLPSALRGPLREALSLEPQDRPADAGALLSKLRPVIMEHAGAFEDAELASFIREAFPDGWSSGESKPTGDKPSGALRSYNGDNETFATRLTAINPDAAEDAAAVSLADATPVGDPSATLSDGPRSSHDGLEAVSASNPAMAKVTPGRSRASLGILLLGAAAIGGAAFGLVRNDRESGPSPTVAAVPAGEASSSGLEPPPLETKAKTEPSTPPADSGANPIASEPPTEKEPPVDPVGVAFSFKVEPADAKVVLGGEPVEGPSPYALSLDPDEVVSLKISKPGYVTKRLSVNPAQPLPTNYVLERPAPKEPGFLRVSAPAVPWAEVRVDGRKVGTTPTSKLNVTAGRHRLEVMCIPDACPQTRTLLNKTIIIEPGKLNAITAGS